DEREAGEATDPLPELGPLVRGRGVASGGPGTDREELEGPARDRRTGRRVDPHGEDDPGEDRPRPARVQPRELLATSAREEIQQARGDRQLRHAEDVAELSRNERRHDRTTGGRRRG